MLFRLQNLRISVNRDNQRIAPVGKQSLSEKLFTIYKDWPVLSLIFYKPSLFSDRITRCNLIKWQIRWPCVLLVQHVVVLLELKKTEDTILGSVGLEVVWSGSET